MCNEHTHDIKYECSNEDCQFEYYLCQKCMKLFYDVCVINFHEGIQICDDCQNDKNPEILCVKALNKLQNNLEELKQTVNKLADTNTKKTNKIYDDIEKSLDHLKKINKWR